MTRTIPIPRTTRPHILCVLLFLAAPLRVWASSTDAQASGVRPWSAPYPPHVRALMNPSSTGTGRLKLETPELVEVLQFHPETQSVSCDWQVLDVDVRRPRRLDVAQQIARVGVASRERLWRRSLQEARRAAPATAGGGILDDITTFDIPIQFPGAVSSIIGQGANIEVSGSENITFGGESSYLVEDTDYGLGQRSRFPQLNMEQHLRVNLDGTIGEKIHVLVDHDSEVQTTLENKIKLRYEGDEDEVIQSIEMGNTNLSLGGAQFVGYRGQAQGLFGAKMAGRLGALDFTTIASKQEGRTSNETFVGQAREEATRIRDLDFERRRFYSARLPEDPVYLVFPQGKIESLSVWVDDDREDTISQTPTQPGFALVRWTQAGADTASTIPPTARDTLGTNLGSWVQLDEYEDYTVNQDVGVITLQRPLDETYSLAISYYAPAVPELGLPGRRIGSVDGDTLSLQMIHPGSRISDNWRVGSVWYSLLGTEIKNVYWLGARNIARGDYNIVIRRRTSEGIEEDQQGGTPFIQLMGLDRGTFTDAVSDPTKPDGIVDPEWIDFDGGYLYFPNYQPFDPDSTLGYGYDLTVRNPELYTQSETYIRNRQNELQRYTIEATYRTPQTTFRLNRIGIIHDSEVVTLNGRKLARGVDYNIDYDLGEVTFVGTAADEASSGDAQIAIDFEYAPLLAQAQKTLFGVQGKYQFTDQNNLGVMWLFESTTTPELRPRLGQEPTRNMVGDLNFNLQSNPNGLTRMMNGLPLVTTQAASQLRVAGEVAASLPNPNTKNEVYIDDMDGSEDVRALGISWRQWVPASRPLAAAESRYRPNWYSPRDLVRERDLFLGLTGNEGDALRTVLELRPHPDQEVSADPDAWVGIMRLLSQGGARLTDQKYIEIWVDNGAPVDRTGVMHVDLGDMSEDFYRPGEDLTEPDDEDTNNDGILDEDEDVGLDGVAGKDGEGVPGDDGNDDYEYDYDHARREYRQINGYERNRIRDTEDLNGNGTLDLKNGYFTAQVDLSDAATQYVAADNADSLSEDGSHWRLFRIPLDDFHREGSGIEWDAIRYARLWFTGYGPGDSLRIGSMEIIGNSWLEDGVRDVPTGLDSLVAASEGMSVQVRNNKENSEYTPPFDVEEEQTPQGRIQRREQSLALVYDELGSGHFGMAHKAILQTTEQSLNDYSEYRELSFYVRAQEENPGGRYPTVFIRLGADSANFYEYRLPVESLREWQSVDVPLGDLPQLKLDAPADTVRYNNADNIEVRDPGWGVPPGVPAGSTVAVYGKPSLTRILYLAVGVRNEWDVPIGGEVWVDELRLRDVRKQPGYATSLNGSMQLADVANANFSFNRKDEEFRTLGGDRSGVNDVSFTAGARMNLHKFFEKTGFALPVTVNYRNSNRQPRLLTGSDVVLDQDLRQQERTESNNRSATVTLSHPTRSAGPFGQLFLDGLQSTVSMSSNDASSPEQANENRTVSASISYLLAPPFEPSIRVLKSLRLAYLPQSVSLRMSGSRVADKQWNMLEERELGALRVNRKTRTMEGNLSVRGAPLTTSTMSTDYSFEMDRDLDTDKQVPFMQSLGWGKELRRRQTASWRFQPSFFGLVTPVISYEANYTENQSATIRRADDPPGLRQITNSGDFRTNASVSLSSFLRRVDGWWKDRAAKERHKEAERAEAERKASGAPAEEAPRRDELAPRGEAGTSPGMTGSSGGPSLQTGEREPDEETRLEVPPVLPPGVKGSSPPAPAPDSGEAGPAAPPAPGEKSSPGEESPPRSQPPLPQTPRPPPAAERSGPGVLERLTRWTQKLQDVSINYNLRRDSQYPRVLERPPLDYQLGFNLAAPSVDSGTLAGQTSSSQNRTRSLSIGTGARPTRGVSLDVSYSRSRTAREAAGSTSATNSITWPDLGLNLSSLEKWKPVAALMQRASVSSNFRRKVDESEAGGELRDRRIQISFSPLVQLSSTFANGLQLTFTGNHSRSSSDNFRGVGNQSRTRSTSASVSGRYAIRPAAARGRSSENEIKLSTDLRLSFDNADNRVGENGQWEETSNTTVFSIEPQASYTFNRNMTGSARAAFSQNRDHKRGETRRRIGLFFSLNIRF